MLNPRHFCDRMLPLRGMRLRARNLYAEKLNFNKIMRSYISSFNFPCARKRGRSDSLMHDTLLLFVPRNLLGFLPSSPGWAGNLFSALARVVRCMTSGRFSLFSMSNTLLGNGGASSNSLADSCLGLLSCSCPVFRFLILCLNVLNNPPPPAVIAWIGDQPPFPRQDNIPLLFHLCLSYP